VQGVLVLETVVKRESVSYISKTMLQRLTDTIVAISTPIGEGGISVLRVSGTHAIEKVAKSFSGKTNLSAVATHTAHFGNLIDASSQIIDEVVCTVFKSPHSYTGEDTVEISCHGGVLITRRILETIIHAGARQADPGEFTRRAFLNGKMDLSQAEAVADLIHAQSDKARQSSLAQLEGVLSTKIKTLRGDLIQMVGLLELELDFVEEDLEFVDKKKVEDQITQASEEIKILLNTYQIGKVYREGIKVAIVGAPNVGKSSLLNALLNESRAIVTDIPGTTRDFIEEKFMFEGVLFQLTDTAGLRETDDLIEQEGVKRTKKRMEKADVVLWVKDATQQCKSEYPDFVNDNKIISVFNKIDLLDDSKKPDDSNERTENVVYTSARTGYGLENLKQALFNITIGDLKKTENDSVTVTNARHFSSFGNAKEALERAAMAVHQKESNEFIALELRSALDSLGEIIGVVTTEEILDSIFSKFCIGK
jgi:tRNA modification GTPase